MAAQIEASKLPKQHEAHPWSSSAERQRHTSNLPSDAKLTKRSVSSVLPNSGSLALLLCQLTAVMGSLEKHN